MDAVSCYQGRDLTRRLVGIIFGIINHGTFAVATEERTRKPTMVMYFRCTTHVRMGGR